MHSLDFFLLLSNLATILVSQSTLHCQFHSLLYQFTNSPSDSPSKLSQAVLKYIFEQLSLCGTVYIQTVHFR